MAAPKEQVRQLQTELSQIRQKLNQTEAELAQEQAAVNAFRMHCRLKLDSLVDMLQRAGCGKANVADAARTAAAGARLWRGL
ncbi:MAG: hypothetical protein M5U34_23380 [Chloroflexi bacterium]|nr:hypothetical protein [Chloroflexota bacterium]